MLIINADDWGRSRGETDAALRCYQSGRITSVSAMVFMEDSERAAELAKETQVDAGLHLNFSEEFTDSAYPEKLRGYHNKICRFLRRSKYAQLLYNPWLRAAFSYSVEAQAEEFERLFGKLPSHLDGHHHMHLCANLIFSRILPDGMKMRPHFSFWPGEKSYLNIAYRKVVNRWFSRRYRMPDFFFDLTQCIDGEKFGLVEALAKRSVVELMTHPVNQREGQYLLSDEFHQFLKCVDIGNYAAM